MTTTTLLANPPAINGHHKNGTVPSNDHAIQRLPPHSIEAEEATLGSILIDPDMYFEIAHFLKGDMFYRVQNRWVYEAICALMEKREPLDFLTLSEELRRNEKLAEIGGDPYLIGLINVVPTSVNAVHYAHLVESASIRRRMIGAASTIANLAFDEAEDIGVVVDRAEQTLFTVSASRVTVGSNSIKAVAHNYMAEMERRMGDPEATFGVPSGVKDLDRMMNGFQKGNLVTLAGRPGMGKTALMNYIAITAALKYKKRVGIFNLEMNSGQLMERMIATETGIDNQKLRRGELTEAQMPMFYEAIGRLSTAKIFIDDCPYLTPMQLRTKCRRLYAEHGLDLVMVDYMQLMTVEGHYNNKVAEVSEISRSLKLLARELDVPLIAAAQLSRAVESRSDKRPMLSDLRDSGSVEQDSDDVIFLYRDSYYTANSQRGNITEIILSKQRNGPTGTVETEMLRGTGRFVDISLGSPTYRPPTAPAPLF